MKYILTIALVLMLGGVARGEDSESIVFDTQYDATFLSVTFEDDDAVITCSDGRIIKMYKNGVMSVTWPDSFYVVYGNFKEFKASMDRQRADLERYVTKCHGGVEGDK